jgi:hypothetical protein
MVGSIFKACFSTTYYQTFIGYPMTLALASFSVSGSALFLGGG